MRPKCHWALEIWWEKGRVWLHITLYENFTCVFELQGDKLKYYLPRNGDGQVIELFDLYGVEYDEIVDTGASRTF